MITDQRPLIRGIGGKKKRNEKASRENINERPLMCDGAGCKWDIWQSEIDIQ